MVLEYAAAGNLHKCLIKAGNPFSERIARCFIKQILNGIDIIHRVGLTHRDIKLDNILLSDNYILKIADFGFVGYLTEGNNDSGLLTDVKGTKVYMAPEILKGNGYDGIKVDIFSAGVCLFMLTFRRFPFGENAYYHPLFNNLEQNQWNEFWN